jgi:hypothetical protein
MNEPQAVIPLDAGSQPNKFFLRSPFRSWEFICNTVLLVADCLGCAFLLYKQPDFYHSLVPLILLFSAVVTPYRWALSRHRKIRELLLSGQLALQPAGTPQSILLAITDRTLNEGLFVSSFVFGAFLFVFIQWKLH